MFNLLQSYPWVEEPLLFIKYFKLLLPIFSAHLLRVLFKSMANHNSVSSKTKIFKMELKPGFYIQVFIFCSCTEFLWFFFFNLILDIRKLHLFSILLIQKSQICMWKFKAKYFQLKWATFFKVNLDIYVKEKCFY